MTPDHADMSVEHLTLDPTKPRKIAMSTTATCEVWSNYPTTENRQLNGTSTTNAPIDSQEVGDKAASKYCYRHRPDLKCRRQANEPTMEDLQQDLSNLPQANQQSILDTWTTFSAAPPAHRKLILQGILAKCCFPQLSIVAAAIRELVKIDFLTALPDELALKILCFLDPTSICKAAQVSERWRKLADDDVVWHKMCEQHIDRKCVKCGWGLPLLDRKRLRTEKRQSYSRGSGAAERLSVPRDNQNTPDEAAVASKERASLQAASLDRINGHGKRVADSPESDDASSKRPRRDSLAELVSNTCRDTTIQPRLQPWKAVYRDRFRIGYNWKHGRYTSKTFKGHENGVMCLQFDGNLLATGSYDTTIKLWDIDAGKEIRTLNGHSLGVRCLHFDDSKLISGALDGTVKVWDLKSGRLLRTLLGHKEGVISLHLDHHLLASGSMDKTIKVWNFNDPSTFVLRGHTDWVNSVKVDAASRTLFSASDDTTVRLWDLDSKTCFKIFKGHGGQVQSVLFLPPEFDYSNNEETSPGNEDHDHRGVVWTAASITAAAGNPNAPNVDPPLGPVPAFGPNRLEPPRYMLTGSLDSTIRLWDTHSGLTLRTFFGHLEGIWSLAADTLRIVSGGNDGMIKIWDPRTGKCERTFTNHNGPVTCVGLSDRRMFTGSEDHVVRMYNFSIPGEKYQDNH